MLLAGSFAALLFILLILADWVQFTRRSATGTLYGCRVARTAPHLSPLSRTSLANRFDPQGVLHLPHGMARYFQEDGRILVRPHDRLSARVFRTAWPLKGCVEVQPDGERTQLTCIKRMPWSSALITLLWFLLVAGGTLAFFIAYSIGGGLGSLGGVLMGVGILGLGLLVLAFGLVTVSLAYRLEDQRLMQAYTELLAALAPAVVS